MENTRHLRFVMQTAYESGVTAHPQVAMKSLGITYQDSIPQSIGDQWWFINCKNIPEELPEYLEYLPIDTVNYGIHLTKSRS